MKRFILIIIVITIAGSARAQFNGCLPGFCPGTFGGGGNITPPTTGKILLVDGASFLLQTNASSKICRAGGC